MQIRLEQNQWVSEKFRRQLSPGRVKCRYLLFLLGHTVSGVLVGRLEHLMIPTKRLTAAVVYVSDDNVMNNGLSNCSSIVHGSGISTSISEAQLDATV